MGVGSELGGVVGVLVVGGVRRRNALKQKERGMSERRMRAYYYGFKPTGVEAIDLILHAIACAGKAYHHTDQWNEECSGYGECIGNSPIEWIQNAADQAAKQWPVPHD